MSVSSPSAGCGRAAARTETATSRASPSGWAKRSAKRRGVPALPRGYGQYAASPRSSMRVVDARVVGDAALGREAQLLEDELGVGVERGRALESPCELGEDPQLVANARGRRDRAAAADDATLERGHRALLLGPLRDRQHHVGEGRGLGEEEVADHEQVERGDALAHRLDVR